MNVWVAVAIGLACGFVGFAVWVVRSGAFARAAARAAGVVPFRAYPCYRCATPAEVDYMGLKYCLMCRIMVVQMLPAVRHDPPYGFPGATGYVEFPAPAEVAESQKKEEA